ncbi:MAG: hypothetical protein WA777_11305 [Rhodanobacter sp.]
MNKLRVIPAGVWVGLLLVSMAALAHAEDTKLSYSQVENAAAVDSQRADFNRSLKRLGFAEELGSCKLLVKLHQDVRDDSFGGICSLGGTPARDVLVCDDTMIGKFTIKAWGFAETADEVATFTRLNCPGGG